MAGYTPAFSSIYDGTLCGKWPTAVLWASLLPLIDARGEIRMSYEAIAARTGWPMDLLRQGINDLMQPDPDSQSEAEEGRRLVLLDPAKTWGWRAVNHALYREKARLMSKAQREVASGENRGRMKDRRRPPPTAGGSGGPPPTPSPDSDSNTDKNKISDPSDPPVAQSRDDAALTVFVHWQREWKHPTTKLDQKRRKRIEARLKDFTAAQLCDAISGFRHSPWHTGTDPKGNGTVYDSIDTLLRDSAQVEKGIALFAHPPRPPPKPETAHDRMQRLLNGDDSRVIEHEPDFPAISGH